MSVSICILTCNRDHLLKPLLHELHRQLQPADEIQVLDTGISESTRDVVNELGSNQIFYSAFYMESFDFATARNELLRLAAGEGVVFIDDDACPFQDWLAHVRYGLEQLEAAGGITVADGELPVWWDPHINWCVGLSPPGTVLGMPGYYPDTCNLSARSSLWREHPFHVITREDRQLYVTGREDAEWWLDRRLEGRNIATNYRQAVAHHVHQDRLRPAYVKQRARNDGISSWLRRPSYEAATAIPWDLAHAAGVAADRFFRNPLNRKCRLADVIWMNRQWGKFLAVWKSPVQCRPRRREQVKQLGKAAMFQARIRAGEAAFRTINFLRHRQAFPAAAPDSVFISADCHVGDSILLRRHVESVASTFPSAEVLVSCRYPVLMTGLRQNTVCLQTAQMSSHVRQRGRNIDAAIVPYFPFGDDRLWRETLAPVGATFDCDVSFSGRRDYIYARRTISKNLELHEHENLARLFRLWPLRQVEMVAPPVVPQIDLDWRISKMEKHGIGNRYVLVQFGAGHDFKEWPLDCWIPFLNEIARQIDEPIVITGAGNWHHAADVAVREVQHSAGIYNLVSDTSLAQLMALVQGAAFFIGCCSGPKHLAMAYRVPTFTLYAATEPERWGAAEDHHLHAYVTALPQKLTAMELQGLDRHHRARLLRPSEVAAAALAHYDEVVRREDSHVN